MGSFALSRIGGSHPDSNRQTPAQKHIFQTSFIGNAGVGGAVPACLPVRGW